MSEYRKNLVALSTSGYEIVSDEPDIRKWKVRNTDGRILGVVDDLIIDKQSRKVRYIVLDLNGKSLNLLSRKILIPIGISHFDELDDIVVLPNVTVEHLATLPGYNKGKITVDEERKIRNIFSPSSPRVEYDDRIDDERFYEHEHFNDSNYYNSRRKHRYAN
jgi:sporulation protein YlmC with PRC-barrel domain